MIKFCHKNKKMFGRNHTKEYHTLLIWTMTRIKKILKSMLKCVISLLALRYFQLMNERENDGQSHQVCEG